MVDAMKRDCSTDSSHQQPLVVVTGWLGCQPKFLRRYNEMYQRTGCRVLNRIAPPHMILHSVYGVEPLILPVDWPKPEVSTVVPTSLQELAWEILLSIHHSESPAVLFHISSNGGCFVWEQIRTILNEAAERNEKIPDNIRTYLMSIRERMLGVVFDSSPCWGLHRIEAALSYCTWQERLNLAVTAGFDYLLVGQPAKQKLIRSRNEFFWQSMRNDTWDLPQLYLYSQDDPICPFDELDELVRHRQRTFGRDRVWRITWESSPHCKHLVQNPDEYQAAVESFVEACLRGTLQSRL
jgi:pimeloyl-ACP methyl ester carboxylesterase